ncbi:MAG: VWA domain-containing protein [Gammaproteobacteria bacterium]|nr:VWA domain-containing protein [Gammaproteobacteria bacterium]
MRNALFILVLALAGTAMASEKALQVEIQSPSAGYTVEDGATLVDVEGIASAIGGVRYLDIMFVMDTSTSLRSSDPMDYRSVGAIGLVENLSPKSDIKIGVVSFDSKSQIAQSMTSDREAVSEALRLLPRSGSTNIAAGITSALAELDRNGRPGSSKVIMLFTDGMSNKNKAYDAAVEATKKGIPIQTLMLGKAEKGSKIMDTIAWATGGTFIPVSDPSKLPEAFLNLRTTGVDSVTLSVNGSQPVPARLAGGTFAGSVPVGIGENRIVAFATSLDGDTKESEIFVNVRDTSCAALEVMARNDGQPAISLNDRAVEVVVDASQSMWGQIEGRSKMEIAKTTLEEVTYWLPDDLDLALRAYGNTSAPKQNNCADSSLLVPFRDNNRDYIRQAIAGLRPTGQTPIGYALNQVARDFESSQSDRIVVLVTDGIESCGGDPITAAHALRQQGIVVHLIGFGLGSAADEDAASLQAIANASGGRYVTAGSAEELKSALAETVATSFSVYQGSTEVASGSLGSAGIMLLPEGDYRVQLHSSPPVETQVSLAPRDSVTLTLEKVGGAVSPFQQREELPHTTCDSAMQPEGMLGSSSE